MLPRRRLAPLIKHNQIISNSEFLSEYILPVLFIQDPVVVLLCNVFWGDVKKHLFFPNRALTEGSSDFF